MITADIEDRTPYLKLFLHTNNLTSDNVTIFDGNIMDDAARLPGPE